MFTRSIAAKFLNLILSIGEKQEEQSGQSSVEAEIEKAEAGIVVKSYT